HERMQNAIDDLWVYTNELFFRTKAAKAMINQQIGVDINGLKKDYDNSIREYLREANLKVPDINFFQKGGKEGIHSEHMGYILSELQYMQRAYPNLSW
ncbi:MAG: phenylacetate-CoA oxygenase subunit PaaI, partial [Flavobacteriaceae bacterium]|nr:phenylacetate-CoA oxygenase subunit PaaI [Flavobacteriaceae bacterium]